MSTVSSILGIKDLTKQDAKQRQAHIERLMQMRTDARAAQRAATESAMVDDDGLNDRLREIDLALQELGIDPDSIEDEGAATL